MGSFCGNCAVSNLPIRAGDEVLWVYAKPKYINSTHDLSNTYWRYAEKLQEADEYKRKNEEFIKKFPNETELMWGEFWTTVEKEIEWGFGEYNDYGWVENEDSSDEYEERRFMVRKSVADKMSEFGKTLISRERYNKKPYLVDNYLYCFLLVCGLVRINLFGHVLLGRQDPDSDEMKEQTFVHKVIGKELRKLTNEIRLEELEYKNWSWRIGIESKIRSFLKKIMKKGE